MPSFILFGFIFFFYSNEFIGEKLEPIHIHVCKGEPLHGAPKWWVGYGGKIEIAKLENIHKYGLKSSDLPLIENVISDNSDRIIEMWHNHFVGYKIDIWNNIK
jgi:hypothetical protein